MVRAAEAIWREAGDIMIIFLYGPDTLRLSRKLRQIVEEYQRRAPRLDFCLFDAVSDRPADFVGALRQNSLFQEKKFFIVKNPISNKDFKEALIGDFEAITKSGHNIVFCQEGKVLKTDRLLALLKKNAEVQEFVFLEDEKLVAWVVREFIDAGNPVSLPVARAVSQLVGNDMWRAGNEIQKLAHRFSGREISVADAAREIMPAVDANIFKTIEAVAQKDKMQAIGLIREHVAKGDHPLYLLAMIAGQFKNLLMVKSSGGSGGAARLGIHPYVYSKAVGQARRFSIEELKRIYQKICQADFAVKTGKVDAETGLDLFVGQL